MRASVSSCVFSQDRVVIAVAYDCVEKMVYWTDITGPAISRAKLSGGDISPVVTTGTADATSSERDEFSVVYIQTNVWSQCRK